MTKRKPIEVIVPDEPPVLTPEAARALLRLLIDAGAREPIVPKATTDVDESP